MPNGITWILIVLAIGTLITVVAAKGYHMDSKAANLMAPIVVVGFLLGGIVALNQLGVGSLRDFWAIWGEGTDPFPGQIKYTFWHVVFWSWFCNGAMHIGMSDLSVMRYAKNPSIGWTPAAGMYIGHYMAWIAAALLYAVYLRVPEVQVQLATGQAPAVAPGPLAYGALGVFGVIVVILAGWTTANPTIYRAGLAFQAIIPGLSTAKVTLIAGAIATIAGVFPAVAMKLLDFVALYGFILAPVGAIIAFEHLFGKSFSIRPFYAQAMGSSLNNAVILAWILSMGFFLIVSIYGGVFLPYLTFPAWIGCGILYLIFSKMRDRSAES